MITVLDVENSTTPKDNGKIDMTPYHPNNKLVSVGWCNIIDGTIKHERYVFFYHNELSPTDRQEIGSNRLALQRALDETTLLVGHNIKHDLAWLWESGFKYDGDVYDTKIAEFILARGRKWLTHLSAVAEKYKCQHKKSDLVDDYLKKGIGFEEIPKSIVEEYGRGDVRTTAEIYLCQIDIYEEPANKGLLLTRDMMNNFCTVLTMMECNGIAIDRKALAEVKEEYRIEKLALERTLNELVFKAMGDTPINISSPEQLSKVIYSRRIKDKNEWVRTFNIGTDESGKKLYKTRMSQTKFVKTVREQTTIVKKTRARQCNTCIGTGKTYKTKISGDLYAVGNHCVDCGGTGLKYTALSPIAGFKLTPRNPRDTSLGGFATDKTTLTDLLVQARRRNNADAEVFLKAVMRHNAVETYLNSFVGGIERGLQPNGLLHPRFNQTVAATARLSSSDPNFQNQPRGTTFPVRRTVVSRFVGGSILEGDYAQLEFRCAGELSLCPSVAKAVADGLDVHTDTARIITNAGQPMQRQEAKAHTFKPLYGGSSGTMPEQMYYKTFLTKRYPRIGKWHQELMDTAIQTHLITIPTGRQYYFNAKRTRYGGSTFATQIKNYPVQGFATADIVPLANINMARLLRIHNMKSLLVNTVHDSLVVDVYPGEEISCIALMRDAMLGVKNTLKLVYDIDLQIPLGVELKIGPNWLDSNVVLVGDTTGKLEYTDTYERLAA